jgi:hypothetical protein
MISIEEDQLSKRLRKIRRKKIWNRGRRVLSHPTSEIVLRDSQLLKKPE